MKLAAQADRVSEHLLCGRSDCRTTLGQLVEHTDGSKRIVFGFGWRQSHPGRAGVGPVWEASALIKGRAKSRGAYRSQPPHRGRGSFALAESPGSARYVECPRCSAVQALDPEALGVAWPPLEAITLQLQQAIDDLDH